jgi:hypothetical protein
LRTLFVLPVADLKAVRRNSAGNRLLGREPARSRARGRTVGESGAAGNFRPPALNTPPICAVEEEARARTARD